eukprot:3696164-Amphidinium_carterae.2
MAKLRLLIVASTPSQFYAPTPKLQAWQGTVAVDDPRTQATSIGRNWRKILRFMSQSFRLKTVYHPVNSQHVVSIMCAHLLQGHFDRQHQSRCALQGVFKAAHHP